MDNNKESFYIHFSLDGLIKVSEDARVDSTERISSLLNELLKTDGIISSKGNINIISEFEVAASILNNDTLN